jgi:hypothetical protein
MEIGAMGQLVKIKFPITLWIVCSGSGPDIHYDTLNCMFGLKTICPLQGFQGYLIFYTRPHILQINS